jgi:hypothetical protein
MTEAQQQQQISPERQMMAVQVGAVFNSLHEYLGTLQPTINGQPGVSTKQLELAHCRVDEAAMWAIKSVLTYGAAPQQSANDATPDAPPAAPAQDIAPSPSND